MTSILAFAAHPDDEGAMLGTLYKYSKLNRKVVIVWATRGERWLTPLGKYTPFLHWLVFTKKDHQSREKLYKIINKIRSKEIRKVLSLINVEGCFLDFRDGFIPSPSDHQALMKVIEVIRQYRPKIIITHHFREAHPDHQNLSRLVYHAFYLAGKNTIRTNSAPFTPESLAWWDERGVGFKPNCFINVNNSIRIFSEWKKIYKSQASRLIGQLPMIKARLRALRTPLKLVEGFQILNINIKTKIFAELFPEISQL